MERGIVKRPVGRPRKILSGDNDFNPRTQMNPTNPTTPKRPVGRPRKNLLPTNSFSAFAAFATTFDTNPEFESFVKSSTERIGAEMFLAETCNFELRLRMFWNNPSNNFTQVVMAPAFEIKMSPSGTVLDLISLIHKHTQGAIVVDKVTRYHMVDDNFTEIDMSLMNRSLADYGVRNGEGICFISK